MPYFVYLLSNPASQIYIGQTKNLERRLTEHNNPEYRGSVHTKRRPGPWKLVYSERCATSGVLPKS